MALDFSSMKKSSGGFDKLMKEVEKIATPQNQDKQAKSYPGFVFGTMAFKAHLANGISKTLLQP